MYRLFRTEDLPSVRRFRMTDKQIDFVLIVGFTLSMLLLIVQVLR